MERGWKKREGKVGGKGRGEGGGIGSGEEREGGGRHEQDIATLGPSLLPHQTWAVGQC